MSWSRSHRSLLSFSLCLGLAIIACTNFSAQFVDAQDKPAEAKTDEKPAETKPEGKKDDSQKETAKAPPKKQVRVIALSGSYEDLPSAGGFDPTDLLLGGGMGKPKSFYRLCDYLDELSHEELVTHVVFDLSAAGISMNSPQLDEFTRRLQHLKSHGKKCMAWLESASNVHLAIASGCDEVMLADLGEIDMPSSSMETMFYRDAMDLLGIQASVTRAGDFKGAVEPYLNAAMSKHLKEHYLAMLESINSAQVSRIAKGRGLSVGVVRDLQKKRMLLPAEALANRLVDRLVPYGAMKKTIMDGLGENYEWTTPKSKPKREVSIFELLGKAMAPPKDPSKLKDTAIVVLHLTGAIEDGKTAKPGSIVSGPTVKLIEDLTADDKVKGVVVRINSPGGSATASEAIRQALDGLAKKKPLVYSMGEMAASGGYWITCIGQPIFAEHGTITGSIGVFSLKVSAGTLMRRIGVHVESVTLDSAAGMEAVNRAWTEEEIDKMQGFIDAIYDKFLAIASTSRSIPVETLKKLAGGRVWSGEQAKSNRLIDQLGGLDDALAMVAKGAKLDKYKVVHRPEVSTGLDLGQLLGNQEDEIDIAYSGWSGMESSGLVGNRFFAMLETKLVAMLKEQGFRSDATRLIFRSIDWTGNQPPKAWALMGAELKISH
jgi:protease-4